jgi:hypothetical protein
MTASVTFQEPGTNPPVRLNGLTKQSDRVILAPKKAVTEVSGQTVAWVVTDGKASKRPVTLGADRIDQIEVTSGLMPGETVILNAPAGLTDRAPVRVKGS